MYKDLTNINQDATEVNAIKQSIKNILLTRRGSVPGKPYFGSDLYKIIFRQLDHATATIAKNFIIEALTEFEDRIVVKNVDFKIIEEYNKLVIDITFSYKNIDTKISDTTSVTFNL